VGPNVRGRVTMFLNDVKLKEALFAVLESASLAYVENDRIMTILPEKEYEAAYGRRFYDNRSLHVVPVRHAEAGEIAASLSKLEPRAVILVDERSNSLLIRDAPENLEQLERAAREMDRPVVTGDYIVRHLERKQAEELAKMLLSRKGAVHFNEATRRMTVRDHCENVEKILALLESHDVPARTVTRAYELDYAKFDSLEAKLKLVLTPDLGTVIADERTNKLLVSDLETNFEKIEQLIAEYDSRDRQVLIEAKIVQVILNDRFQWGINWQTVIRELNGSNLGLRLTSAFDASGDIISNVDFAESIDSINRVADRSASGRSETATTTVTTDIDADGKETQTTNIVRTLTESNETAASESVPFHTQIGGPTEGGARIVAVGSIEGRQFEGVLNALESVGDTRVLSSPRIITLHNEPARIQVASKEAYVTSTTVTPGSGPSTTSENVTFLDVGISLDVTPEINKDRFITMSVKPSVSSVTSSVTTASGNRIPIVSSQEVESKIQVKDGVTIILGGIHEQVQDEVENRIPVLGRIPLLGFLFKKIDNQVKNSELVMFLTPRIMTGEKSFYEEPEPALVGEPVTRFLSENNLYEQAREYEIDKQSAPDE
jgi:type II secretory pathway component GspD/PulD (secretin)